MRIEDRLGKAGAAQASVGGFETEDALYLVPLMTLCDGTTPVLILASVCAPLFAIWVAFDYRRLMNRLQLVQSNSG